MDNTLFNSKRIANGYANDRPWLHKSVIEQIYAEFVDKIPFKNGLDVGCGAGLSTKALKLICSKVTGTDISEEMIHICKTHYVTSGFTFYAAKAEETKMPQAPYDIVTAAGVIDWVDKDKFLENMRVVMSENAPLILYDFWISDKMLENPSYTDWFHNQYLANFPKPPRNNTIWEQKDIPTVFSFTKQTICQMQYEFDLSSFMRFMMTQTNINSKVESGNMTEEEVLGWMQKTLRPIFQERRQTLIFDGYIRIYIRGAEDMERQRYPHDQRTAAC